MGVALGRPGADLHGDRAERRGSDQVLQRHAFCTLADKPFVAFDEVGVGFDRRESAAVGAGHVSGQQFGIRAWIVTPAEMTKKANATRKPPMRAYASLPKPDLDALVAFLASKKKK